MQYYSAITKAYEFSKIYKVAPAACPPPFTEKIATEKLQRALGACIEHLTNIGFQSSFELAGRCVEVHNEIQRILEENNVESFFTIGDRVWDDYIYCEMSYDQIGSELSNPTPNNPLKAHVWLTLSDGSILDFTSQPHMDLLQGDREYPIEQSIILKRLDDSWEKGNFRPFLVGKQFLYKTGAMSHQLRG